MWRTLLRDPGTLVLAATLSRLTSRLFFELTVVFARTDKQRLACLELIRLRHRNASVLASYVLEGCSPEHGPEGGLSSDNLGARHPLRADERKRCRRIRYNEAEEVNPKPTDAA